MTKSNRNSRAEERPLETAQAKKSPHKKWLVALCAAVIGGVGLLITSITVSSANAPEAQHQVIETKPGSGAVVKANKSKKSGSSPRTAKTLAANSEEYRLPATSPAESKSKPARPANSQRPARSKEGTKPNMVEGEVPAGTPIEGPINYSE